MLPGFGYWSTRAGTPAPDLLPVIDLANWLRLKAAIEQAQATVALA